MILPDNTYTLKLTTSSTSTIKFDVNYIKHDNTTGRGVAASASGSINTDTTTNILLGLSTDRIQIKGITFLNTGATDNAVTVKKDISGTLYELTSAVNLASNEKLSYTEPKGFLKIDSAGRIKTSPNPVGVNGRTINLLKVGTAKEAGGVLYCYSKDSGIPGAWSPGTPGLAGRTTDGTNAADAGCIGLPDAGTGNRWYLVGGNIAATGTNEACAIVDVLWVNSGLTVTTTTAQTINSVAWPARDVNEATSGKEVQIAVLVTTATTNAGAITNMTLSYTNSDGVAGRTATIASFPATAVVGTIVYFQLQAGDSGVQSVESVTLGTSLVTGAVSLVATKGIVQAQVLQTGSPNLPVGTGGVEIPNRACILFNGIANATAANTLIGGLTFEERSAS